MNIVIVGVGALGKRHLQSMLELPDEYKIYAVEVVEETLNNLKKEFDDRVIFCSEISQLPKEIEVVVIATSSNVRRMVFEQIVLHSKVKNIIFEKVLFQRAEDYKTVNKILREQNIRAWVNCARREWPAYQALKDGLLEAKKMSISITGGDWGLACNGIHMLDLIQYLSCCQDCEIDNMRLLDGVVPSKRKGFYEVHGSINGHCGRCEDFQIICMKESTLPLQISVTTERTRYVISEGKQIIQISTENGGWNWENNEFPIQFQSQLTKKVIEEIVMDGKCELPEYNESMELHLKFIEPLMKHFAKCNMEVGLCPIT